MKVLLMVVLFLVGSNQVRSQYLLGLNEEGVRESARILGGDSSITFNKRWYQDKAYSLEWYDSEIECKVMVAFNKFTGLSVTTCLIPGDSIVLKALVESFDEENIKKAANYWVIRKGNKVMKIEQIIHKEKKMLIFREISPNEEY